MKKPLVSDMTQADFFELFVNCIKTEDLEDFVKKDDIKDFVKKDELKVIVEQAAEIAGNHSTKIIESAVAKSIENGLVRVGIDPQKPNDMQETMAALRKMVRTSEQDMGTFRKTIIKYGTMGTISLFISGVVSGIVVYISKIQG